MQEFQKEKGSSIKQKRDKQAINNAEHATSADDALLHKLALANENFDNISLNFQITASNNVHRVKGVRISSLSRPYSLRKRENTDRKNSKYGHFSCSDLYSVHQFFPTFAQLN